MAKTKQKQTQKKQLIHKEVPCDQWISKKKEPKSAAVNKLRALFGSSVKKNPFIEVQFSTQQLEIKQTKQTSLKKYFINQCCDKSLDACQDSSSTNDNRDNGAKSCAKKESAATENCNGMKSSKRIASDKPLCKVLYPEEDESELDIFEENEHENIRYFGKERRQFKQRKSHTHGSVLQHSTVQKEQFRQNYCPSSDASDLQNSTNKRISGSISLSIQCTDKLQLSHSGSYQDTVCLKKTLESCCADDERTEKSTQCTSSEEYSSQFSDKQVNHKMSVLDAVEQFSMKLKKVKEQVLSDLIKSQIKLDSEMQPMTFHIPESSCNKMSGSGSRDQYFKETQSHDLDRWDDSESYDLTFHIPDKDLMLGFDDMEMLEDSQLSNLTFH